MLGKGLDKWKCATCGAKLDGFAAPGERGPKPGDFSVCVYCSAVHSYKEDGTLAKLDPKTLTPREQREIEHVQGLVARMRRDMGREPPC